MTRNVDCVDLYRRIRAGVPDDASRISVGRSLFPPSEVIYRQVTRLHEALISSGRLTDYETGQDKRERALIADLVNRYLGSRIYSADNVFLTNGSQEAISILCRFGASRGLSAYLPLPVYYSFEQSGLRYGMPVAGYYRYDGQTRWLDERRGGLFKVVIVPNPVTGTFFETPASADRQVDFSVVDCVSQLGNFEDAGLSSSRTRSIVAELDPDRTALTFTVSKDLSLPGLRAGVLISGNRELMRTARADRFERNYSISPIVGQVIASYMGMLAINDRGDALARNAAQVRAMFADNGLPFPSADEVELFFDHVGALTSRCIGNLQTLVDCCDALVFEKALRPCAGFSALPRLKASFRDPNQYLRWVNEAGVQMKLKVNPDFMFGGDSDTWDRLYPEGRRIRVNISERPEELARHLDRLAASLDRFPSRKAV